MSQPHLAYPNESAAYRAARNRLLDAEAALRAQIEAVAAMRRALPPGGVVPENYVFEWIGGNGMPEKVPMSALFGSHRTLVLYSFMYGPERQEPCPMCTHLLDSIEGGARHITQRAALYVVAKSPLARLVDFARRRGWEHLDMLSTAGNAYDADYFGDSSKVPAAMRERRAPNGAPDWDETMFNVFTLEDGVVRHFWGSELTWAQEAPGQHHRSGDAVNALWNMLDMTPEGRGDFMPKLSY
jgi:predicted dithiol-disulfide oxidoreductase (DUF899 family)